MMITVCGTVLLTVENSRRGSKKYTLYIQVSHNARQTFHLYVKNKVLFYHLVNMQCIIVNIYMYVSDTESWAVSLIVKVLTRQFYSALLLSCQNLPKHDQHCCCSIN